MRVSLSPWARVAGSSAWAFAHPTTHGVGWVITHAVRLERIFEFLREFFDVVGRPVLDVHAKMQTHP
jgi:hypothetical protein